VEQGALHELPRQIEPLGGVQIVLHLPDQQVPTSVALARVETVGIEAVVVEAVDHDPVPAKEVQHLGVQLYLAEQVELPNVFDRIGRRPSSPPCSR
jgi:hypothetical protein